MSTLTPGVRDSHAGRVEKAQEGKDVGIESLVPGLPAPTWVSSLKPAPPPLGVPGVPISPTVICQMLTRIGKQKNNGANTELKSVNK